MAHRAASLVATYFHSGFLLSALRYRWCTAVLCAVVVAGSAWAEEKKAATPVPSAKPARGTPAPAPPSSEADNGQRALEEIFACVAQGLPEGWQRAWVTVKELSASRGGERTFEAHYQVSLERSGERRWDFVPCNARDVAERVYRLNEYLEPAKRNWKTATLLFTADSKFELKYDYAP